MSGRKESEPAQNLARQVADLKQEIKELGKPGKDAWEWLSEEHNPLSPDIRRVRVSEKVKLSPDTYDGKTDPADHLNHFRAFHNLEMCRTPSNAAFSRQHFADQHGPGGTP